MTKTTALTDIPGIGEATAATLQAGGLNTADDVAAAAIEDITAVPGFGYTRAARIRSLARDLVGSSAAPDSDTSAPVVKEPAEVPAVSVAAESPLSKPGKKKKKDKDKKKGKDKKKDKKKKGGKDKKKSGKK